MLHELFCDPGYVGFADLKVWVEGPKALVKVLLKSSLCVSHLGHLASIFRLEFSFARPSAFSADLGQVPVNDLLVLLVHKILFSLSLIRVIGWYDYIINGL
jgi:hypothetical protein